jgi:hypothetical protein
MIIEYFFSNESNHMFKPKSPKVKSITSEVSEQKEKNNYFEI